jgi:carbon monoxide dehydrogenase subunit G
MRFAKDVAVAVPPEKVWAFLWDVERVARCLPGCREVRTVVPHERYEAVVGERVGPFKVQFPLEIQVLEADEARRLRAQATGRDTAVGSALKVLLDLQLEKTDTGSRLTIVTETSILGKLATLGHSVIQHKADGIMTQFAQAIQRELEGMA